MFDPGGSVPPWQPHTAHPRRHPRPTCAGGPATSSSRPSSASRSASSSGIAGGVWAGRRGPRPVPERLLRHLAAAGHRRAADHPQARRRASSPRSSRPGCRRSWAAPGASTRSLSGIMQGAARGGRSSRSPATARTRSRCWPLAGLASAAAAFVHDVHLLVRRLRDRRPGRHRACAWPSRAWCSCRSAPSPWSAPCARTGVLDGFPT